MGGTIIPSPKTIKEGNDAVEELKSWGNAAAHPYSSSNSPEENTKNSADFKATQDKYNAHKAALKAKGINIRAKGGPVISGESYIVGEKGPELFVPQSSGNIVPNGKKMKKHNFTSTHVEIHDDGSATIHHKHAEGEHKDVRHAASDLDGIHDSMEEHLNPEKMEKSLKNKGLDPEKMEEKVSPGIHDKVAKLAATVDGE